MKELKFIGIIPARYASTRFPGKPLAKLGGKYVIQRVYEQVSKVLPNVVVALDDERIADAVEEAAERLNAASALADDEHGVEREGDVLFVEHGKIGLLLCILFGELGALLAAQGAEHTAENQQEALAARVDDAGLFENGVHVSRLRERDLALGDGLLEGIGIHLAGHGQVVALDE